METTPTQIRTGNTFDQAIMALQVGYFVRLPEWTGYWFLDSKDGGVKVYTRTGDVLDTPRYDDYCDRTDWVISTTRPGLGFDFAILALKAGKRVARQGWNGKNMYVFLRPSAQIPVSIIQDIVSLPQSVKDELQASTYGETTYASGERITIPFTPYACLKAADGSIVNGWLPSQTDLLAEDWVAL
jgi:hypothetical protein